MTATHLPQCEDCPVRPIGSDARCAWCIATGRYRRDPLSAADRLPPWLSNTEIDRTRRRSTVEAILRNYRPDQVNWSAVASLLGVSRQAVHQLKRRLVESSARPPEEGAAVEEAYTAAAEAPRRRRRSTSDDDGGSSARDAATRAGGRRTTAGASAKEPRRS